jgi:pilus assembly protein Flp/PilA
MRSIRRAISQFVAAEEGVTMIEYGLLAALIAVVCIAAITVVGTQLNKLFTTISDAVTTAVSG